MADEQSATAEADETTETEEPDYKALYEAEKAVLEQCRSNW